MLKRLVRVEGVRPLWVMCVRRGLCTRAGGTGLCVYNNAARQQAAFYSRGKPQQSCRRKAARVRDQTRVFHRLPIQFREAVNKTVLNLTGMIELVKTLKRFSVVYPKIPG